MNFSTGDRIFIRDFFHATTTLPRALEDRVDHRLPFASLENYSNININIRGFKGRKFSPFDRLD